jgi:hypothetical protein
MFHYPLVPQADVGFEIDEVCGAVVAVGALEWAHAVMCHHVMTQLVWFA